MDKLQALRRKLKKEQEEKQEEKKADMPAAQLGYDRQPQQGQNGSHNPQKQEQQPQQIKEAIQQQKQREPSKSQQLGYAVNPKAEKPQPVFQQHKFEGQLSPLKRQAAEPQSMASDSNYGYQNASQIPSVYFSPKPQITSEPEPKSQIVHSQKQPHQSSQASHLGYAQPIFTTPVKQSLLEEQVAPQSTEEKKKSKIEMLREKMRLKKLTEQQNLSNNSIPEPPQQNSNQAQSLGYKDLPEVQNQEDNHGGKKAHIIPVKEAVLFEGMREDRITVVPLTLNIQIQEDLNARQNQQSKEPQNIQNPINPQNPLAIQSHHTLFYRLNELHGYLKAENNLKQKPLNEQGGIKQFIEQLQLLKQNIEHFNNF